MGEAARRRGVQGEAMRQGAHVMSGVGGETHPETPAACRLEAREIERSELGVPFHLHTADVSM